jgi:hypothetical protein
MIPVNRKLRLLSSHIGFIMPLTEQTETRIIALTSVTNSDYHEEIALAHLHNGGSEDYV